MRTRLNIVVVSFLAMLVVMMLVVARDRGGPGQESPRLAATDIMGPVEVASPAAPISAVAPAPTVEPAPATVIAPAAIPVADGDKLTYTAQWGDTVSNLAAELPGGNVKGNRAAVINANPALQADPDRLIAGRTYEIPADATVTVAATPATTP